jgi:hypothetical protein
LAQEGPRRHPLEPHPVGADHARGKTLTASKAKPGDANYAVAEVPKGRELTSETSANGLASVLSGLRMDDVFKRADVPEPDANDVRSVRYEGWDGLVVSGLSWEKDGKAYAHFEANLVEAKAKDDIREQQARDKADFEARKAEFEAKAKSEAKAASDAKATSEAAKPIAGAAPGGRAHAGRGCHRESQERAAGRAARHDRSRQGRGAAPRAAAPGGAGT